MNGTDSRKPKLSEKNVSQCHFFHHNFHKDDLRSKPRQWEASN
jgi:hypothetical protein